MIDYDRQLRLNKDEKVEFIPNGIIESLMKSGIINREMVDNIPDINMVDRMQMDQLMGCTLEELSDKYGANNVRLLCGDINRRMKENLDWEGRDKGKYDGDSFYEPVTLPCCPPCD
ncbi:MAG: hypothetical protein R3B38_00310 [Patescibacteria group bacterium]